MSIGTTHFRGSVNNICLVSTVLNLLYLNTFKLFILDLLIQKISFGSMLCHCLLFCSPIFQVFFILWFFLFACFVSELCSQQKLEQRFSTCGCIPFRGWTAFSQRSLKAIWASDTYIRICNSSKVTVMKKQLKLCSNWESPQHEELY